MFEDWASSEFSTDWGTRDVGEHEPIYDPISYHQGSVWPLFTGWASLAEYRSGRPLSGYAHLMQNLNMTWTQDLGAVTELLSGAYFQPLGRSTTHQLWSSAMVLTPALRGLFGVSVHGKTVFVDPHLPADWDNAVLRHVPVEGDMVDLSFHREGNALHITLEGRTLGITLRPSADPSEEVITAVNDNALAIRLPGAELAIPAELPLPGARTLQLKVLEQHAGAHSATWLLEGQAGSQYSLPLRLNGIKAVQPVGATLVQNSAREQQDSAGARVPNTTWETLSIQFPAGSGYTRQTVTVHW
jgi:hypothetical protein